MLENLRTKSNKKNRSEFYARKVTYKIHAWDLKNYIVMKL